MVRFPVMRSIRSGAPPRFLLFRSPEYWAIRSEFFVFQLLFGFFPLLACLIVFSSCGFKAAPRLLDPEAPMYRLSQPLTEAEREGGIVRTSGTLVGEQEICRLVHEHKSGKNWREDFRTTVGGPLKIDVVRAQDSLEDGPFAHEILEIDASRVRYEPEMDRAESARETFWRKQVKIPSGGRLYESCLHPGDRLFVDACRTRDGSNVGACGRRPPTLTLGDGTPEPRIDELAAGTAGSLSLLGGAVLLILLYGVRAIGARSFAAALSNPHKRLPSPPLLRASALWGIGLAPLGLLLGLFVFRLVAGGPAYAKIDRYPYVLSHAVCAGALLFGVRMWDRRRTLAALIATLREQNNGLPFLHGPLKNGEKVALDAEVDPRAPLFEAPLSGARRAYWAASVTRVYRNGKNYDSSKEADRIGPTLVPIRAPGGAALLDLRNAAVSLRAYRVIARKKALIRGDYHRILGSRAPFDGAYVLEERFLDPGEALYVAGRVQRLTAPSMTTGYRDAGAVPALGGTPDEPLVVYAGSRRSLLASLVWESRFHGVGLVLAALSGLVTAGLTLYLMSL